jgi:protein O-mannosyl-transferase
VGKETKLLHIVIILVTGAVAYLSAPLAGILGLDDVTLFSGLMSSDFSVTRLLFSGNTGYYRPLPYISYAFDAYVAGGNPAWFHLANVAIHLLNGILVFFLMLNLSDESERKGYLALTAGLIFTLHPVNSEAVMWISSRSDLLCTFFSLATLLLMLQIRESPRPFSFCCLFIAYLLSLFSKEASIILLATVPLYLLSESRMKDLKAVVLITAPLFCAALLYFFLRGGEKAVIDHTFSKAVTSVIAPARQSPGSNIIDLLAVYGFYLKKLIYPFPLNFAIVTIDRPLALVTFVLSAPAATVLFYRNRLSRLPLLVIFAGIALPLIAYTTKLPWTPYAERYLYLPMVGFSLLLALFVNKVPKLPRIAPVALVLFMAIPTIYRVSLWADPVAFWSDIVAKSPGFQRGYVSLAAAQIDVRDFAAAQKNLSAARAIGVEKDIVWNLIATACLAQRDYAGYETAMLKQASISSNPEGVYLNLIENLMKIPEKKMARRTAYEKAIGYHLKILEKSPSFYSSYYNVAKLYWVLGDNRNASHYLRLFISKVKNDPMLPYARKILEKINSTQPTASAFNTLSRET